MPNQTKWLHQAHGIYQPFATEGITAALPCAGFKVLQVHIHLHANSQVCRWSVAPGFGLPKFGIQHD